MPVTKNYNLKEKRMSRNSNIELCRILCMLLIIAHHGVVHGGAIGIPENHNINKIISLFLIPCGKLGFDCFLAISCWFLVDQDFKSKRFIRMWLQVLFYSVLFSIIAFLFGTDFSLTAWLSVLLPITGNSHGFAAAYLAFYLLLPFLKRMTDNLNKKQARCLLILLLYFEAGSQIIGFINQYSQQLYSELLLFILCYIIALNLKKWPIKVCQNGWGMFGIFYLIWFSLYMIKYLHGIYPESPILTFFSGTMYDESSITNLIGGFALFFAFNSMKVRSVPIINCLATGTFGILLFHDHNFFRYVLWKDIFKTETWYYHKQFILLLIGAVVTVYIIGFIIDKIRTILFEEPIFRNISIIRYCDKFDCFINENIKKI